jgi:hypothetical protein
LDALLDRGLLTSQTRTRLIADLGNEHGWFRDTDNKHPAGADTGSPADPNIDSSTGTNTPASPRYGFVELSVWQHYLISEWLFHHSRLDADYDTESIPGQETQDNNSALVGPVAQRFLRRSGVGAERRFVVSVSPDGTIAEFAFWSNSGDGGGAMQESPSATCWIRLPPELPLGKVKPRDVGDPTGTYTGSWEKPKYVCSLRSWIAGLEGFADKEELLRLVDGQERSPGDMCGTEQEETSPVADSKVSGSGMQLTIVRGTGHGYIIVLTLVVALVAVLMAAFWSG